MQNYKILKILNLIFVMVAWTYLFKTSSLTTKCVKLRLWDLYSIHSWVGITKTFYGILRIITWA